MTWMREKVMDVLFHFDSDYTSVRGNFLLRFL